MRIQVEFLLTHETRVFDVDRVPCIGEQVSVGLDGPTHEVKDVIHILTKRMKVRTIVRVK